MTTQDNAYTQGRTAYSAGVPFNKNPHKEPERATGWSVGWTDQRKWKNDKSMPKSVKKRLGIIR